MTIRRLKTYTGSQGYVYQYYFVGRRYTSGADEYVFDITSDRKTAHPVTVVLSQKVVSAWVHAHGRELSDAEQYAAVKLRLFRAFDEVENLRTAATFHVDIAGMEESLSSLGVD